MESPREVWRRLISLWRRGAQEQRLQEEIAFHIAEQTEANVRRGMSAAEARRTALLMFGGVERTKERARDEYRAVLLEDLGRDVRHALRRLRRTPGFTAASLLTLALGIGASTAIFSVVHGVLLKPLPFDGAERLVSLTHRSAGPGTSIWNQGPATWFAALDHQRVFEAIGAWEANDVSITGAGDPEQVEALAMTHAVLPILRVQPMLGRSFVPGDDEPGAPLRVMLTHGYWQRRFGGEDDVLGRSLRIDGQPAEVIGVLPSTFRFLREKPQIVMPLRVDRADAFGLEFDFHALGRLEPDVTLAEANADMARWIALLPDVFDRMALQPDVRPLVEHVVGDIGDVLWILLAAVGLVLIIACANTTNLFLVRVEGRQREFAMRTALGASTARIARTVFSESMLLAAGAGLVGLALAGWAISVLRRLAPTDLPRVDEIGLDPAVVIVAALISLTSGFAFGLVAVLRIGRSAGAVLEENGRAVTDGPRRQHTRNVLVVSQVALALVLLIVSGLMVRTVVALRQVHPGFVDPEAVQTFRLDLPPSVAGDGSEFGRLHERIAERLEQVPGVASVGLASSITMDGDDNTNPIHVEDTPVPDPPLRRFKTVGPGYVETMGNRIVAGRSITWDDIHHMRPVLVVSEAFAREHWGSPERAIGARARGPSGDAPWRQIVGVTGDERDDGLHRPATPIVYWPLVNDTYGRRSIAYAVRSDRAGTRELLRQLQEAVWEIDPELPFGAVQTLDEIQSRSMARSSFAMIMMAIAASVGLMLGIVGIYGVMTYAVAHRTREIGLRMALGAQVADVRNVFVRRGLLLTAVGLALGAVIALVLTQLVSALLFGVSPVDPMTWMLAAVVLGAVAFVATAVPAQRVARIDPMLALRADV